MKKVVRFKKKLDLNILDNQTFQKRVNSLFDTTIEKKIFHRYNEILIFLQLESRKELLFDNIFELFKSYFFVSLIEEAIEISLTQKGKHDILKNIIDLLSVKKIENAIIGRPMIDAFSEALYQISRNTGLSTSIIDTTIESLVDKFIPKRIKYNSCHECGCSCTCDGSCKGNITKCTSKIAINKKCKHCCDCIYVD